MPFQPSQNYDGLAPTTTKGDITARDTTASVRIPVGANGTFLQASSGSTGGVAWASVTAASVVTLTGATTLPAVAQTVLISGTTFAVTLPSPSTNSGLEYKFIKTDDITTAISVSGTGFLGVTLQTKGEQYVVTCDGTTYWPGSHTFNSTPTPFVPVTFGFGTIVLLNASWSRTADMICVQGRATAGSLGTTVGQICLPSPLALAGSSFYPLGASTAACVVGSLGTNFASVVYTSALAQAGNTAVFFGNGTNGVAGAGTPGATLVATGGGFSFDFRVRVAGWGS